MAISAIRGERLIVRIDGEYLFWMDGVLEGNDALVAEARRLSREKVIIVMPLIAVPCDVDDPSNPAGAIAAMWGVNPSHASIREGYTEIVEALLCFPQEYACGYQDYRPRIKLTLKQNISLFIKICKGGPKQIEISC